MCVCECWLSVVQNFRSFLYVRPLSTRSFQAGLSACRVPPTDILNRPLSGGRLDGDTHSAPSTPATMSKQRCRMLQVERFFRRTRMFDKVERCFEIVAVLATISNEFFGEISSFRQSRNKLNMFSLFRLCRNLRKTRSTLLPTVIGNSTVIGVHYLSVVVKLSYFLLSDVIHRHFIFSWPIPFRLPILPRISSSTRPDSSTDLGAI